MAKLSVMRETLNAEEKELYEKYKSGQREEEDQLKQEEGSAEAKSKLCQGGKIEPILNLEMDFRRGRGDSEAQV